MKDTKYNEVLKTNPRSDVVVFLQIAAKKCFHSHFIYFFICLVENLQKRF